MMDLDQARRRMLLTFDLHEAGVSMMRQTLRRRHPTAEDAEIDRLVSEWLQSRPEHGPDCGFRIRAWTPTRGSA